MKTVLVTGAAGGMGKAVCSRLQAAGWQVFALDIRETPGMEGAVCDVTDPESVEAAAEAFGRKYRRLDAIVHTAGIYDLDAFTEIEDARFTKIFEINVFGVYRVTRAFTPFMEAGGRIIVITSELAPLDPLPFTGIYAVTKAALEKYAYSLRTELSLRGISVSIVRPGAVKTGLLNVSTTALEKFVARTQYYKPNAQRFYQIVNSIEARSIPPEKIAQLVERSLNAKKPRYVYNINRNFLLLLLSALPDHLQTWILQLILKR